jgi:hypothetical protein
MPSLFGFAPGGVYHAASVTSCAVRFYRTISTLPYRDMAVYFLWHYPLSYLSRELPGTVPRWSPDFPPVRSYPRTGGCPTLWLNFVSIIHAIGQEQAPQNRATFSIDNTV